MNLWIVRHKYTRKCERVSGFEWIWPLFSKAQSLTLQVCEQKLMDKDDKEIDTIRIDSWNTDTIVEFFKERLG